LTARKVNRIVSLAPCLRVDLDNFYCPLRELNSIEAFYNFLTAGGLTNLFAVTQADLNAFCSIGGTNQSVCDSYLLPDLDLEIYKSTGIKYFKHAQLNSANSTFQPLSDSDITSYPIDQIQSISMHALMGQSDSMCPASLNSELISKIPGIALDQSLSTLDHLDFISNNEQSFFDKLMSNLDTNHVPIAPDDVGAICPEVDQSDGEEEEQAVPICGDSLSEADRAKKAEELATLLSTLKR